MDQAASLQMKLAKKDAIISSLERTSQLQNEAVMALREEVANLRKQLAAKDRTVAVLEVKVKDLNDVVQEKDIMTRAMKSELDHKTIHVVELANELRAVEEELIGRHCRGIDTFEEESMPSLAMDSLSIERRRKKKQTHTEAYEQ